MAGLGHLHVLKAVALYIYRSPPWLQRGLRGDRVQRGPLDHVHVVSYDMADRHQSNGKMHPNRPGHPGSGCHALGKQQQEPSCVLRILADSAIAADIELAGAAPLWRPFSPGPLYGPWISQLRSVCSAVCARCHIKPRMRTAPKFIPVTVTSLSIDSDLAVWW